MVTAMLLAALSAVATCFLFFTLVTNLRDANETRWLSLMAKHDSALKALGPFVRYLFYSFMSGFASVQNLKTKSALNLARAGNDQNPEQYVGDILWEGFLITLTLVLLIILLGGTTALFLAFLLGGLWSFFIRPSLLDSEAEFRSRQIYRRIPYALDLSILVLETGGTLRQALEETSAKDDPLAEEFRIALAEIDSGASQKQAFENLSKRIALEPLETVLTAINRGEEMGAPMVETLVTQAQAFREARLQQVEKLAVEAPTKMTFPNMMFMFAVLLLIVGPLLIQLLSSGIF